MNTLSPSARTPGRSGQAMLPKGLLELRNDIGGHPVSQTGADLLAPLLGLALAGRKRCTCIADQICGDSTDVVGEVHILREALNDALGLREGGATLETEMRRIGRAARCCRDHTIQTSFPIGGEGARTRWRPAQGPPDVRRQRARRTQPCGASALTSCAIHVGRRARADATSFISAGGSLARSARSAAPAFSGPNHASARTTSPAARPGKIYCHTGACRNSTVWAPSFRLRLGPDVR